MKRAALGIRMHSGWGVLVAVSEAMDILDRRRIVVTNDVGPRGNQPFHHAQDLGPTDGEKYLSRYRLESESLARQAIEAAIKDMNSQGYKVAAAAVLEASGRPLPALAKILDSHPLIHTAEGVLFREVVCSACECLKIPVSRYRERGLEQVVRAALGNSAQRTTQRFATAGKLLGPPWTADHKAAALAAYISLSDSAMNAETD